VGVADIGTEGSSEGLFVGDARMFCRTGNEAG
jgi:hypothetical protein